MEKAEEEVRLRNQAVGDGSAFTLSASVADIMMKLDEIQFIRNMGMSLGVRQDDLDQIVRLIISREFAPLNRKPVDD
jgi:hypothetical protein